MKDFDCFVIVRAQTQVSLLPTHGLAKEKILQRGQLMCLTVISDRISHFKICDITFHAGYNTFPSHHTGMEIV